MVAQRRAALAAACLAALALASCASFQRGRDRDAVRQVTGLLNAGRADRLAAMSAVPFLVDGEIVPLKEDVAGFWAGVVKAGFQALDASLEDGEPVGVHTYARFADTMEARTFFIKYAPKDARVVRVRVRGGGAILLVVAPDWTSWRIIGWKGPFTP
jgi:hypothetical protein